MNTDTAFWILAGILSLPLIAYFVRYILVCKPRRGTTEWIKNYDKPHFALTGEAACFDKQQLLYAALAALGATVTIAVRYALISFKSSSGMLDVLMSKYCLGDMLAAFVGGCGMFFLLTSLFSDRTVSLAGGILFGAAASSSIRSAALLVWSFLFFWRWLRQENNVSLSKSFAWLLGAFVTLALATSYVWGLFWLFPLYVVMYICKLLAREKLRAGGEKTVFWLLSGSLTLLTLLVSGWIIWVCLNLRMDYIATEQLPGILFSGSFYSELFAHIPRIFEYLIMRPTRASLEIALIDYAVFACGMGSFIAAIFAVWKRHDSKALAVALACAMLLLVFVLTGSYVVSPAFVCAIGYVWQVFRRRGEPLMPMLCWIWTGLGCLCSWLLLYCF